MSSKGLVIIGVTDESEDLVDAFVEKYQPTYPIVITKNRALEMHLGVRGFPTAAVVEPAGDVSWVGHFDYGDALDDAMRDAERTELTPKAFKKVVKKAEANDSHGAYLELGKILEKGKLSESDLAYGNRLKAFYESKATTAFSRAKYAVERNDVYGAVMGVTPYLDSKALYPIHQEMTEFLKDLEKLETYTKEMKGGAKFAEALTLLRSRRTHDDGVEMLETIPKKYKNTLVSDRALDFLDELANR